MSLLLCGCSAIDTDIDFGHFRFSKTPSYENQINAGQEELAREQIHRAELRRLLEGYTK